MADKPNTSQKKITKFKSKRRVARELVLQGLYQWRLTADPKSAIEAQLRESKIFNRADEAFFVRLLTGVMGDVQRLEGIIQPCLNRSLKDLSPVEYGILLSSTYELLHFIEIPYRAIINEAIELARVYGGSDGYKFVNGVLDKLAYQLRAIETASHSQ